MEVWATPRWWLWANFISSDLLGIQVTFFLFTRADTERGYKPVSTFVILIIHITGVSGLSFSTWTGNDGLLAISADDEYPHSWFPFLVIHLFVRPSSCFNLVYLPVPTLGLVEVIGLGVICLRFFGPWNVNLWLKL
jgi:hypothetical protein